MAAYLFQVNISKYDYEYNDELIKLKENGILMFELPIPKNFYINRVHEFDASTCSICNFEIVSKLLKKPSFIPGGYGNLHISDVGLYEVTEIVSEKIKRLETKRLYYLDTSLLTPDDFVFADAGCKIFDEKNIPNSFWFSNQWRELVNRFCTDKNQKDVKLESVKEFIRNFDCQARLINEYEVLSIIASNRSIDPKHILTTDKIWDSLVVDEDYVFCIIDVNIENQWKIASSIDNPNIYKAICEGEHFVSERMEYHYLYQKEDRLNFPFVIPVIEDSGGKRLIRK